MTSVTRPISCRDVNSDCNGVVDFTYDTSDPLSVTLVFIEEEERVAWTFSREVLARRLPGLCDVKCWTSGPWLHLKLSSPEGTATYRFLEATVAAFLKATKKLVRYGAEDVDVDAALARLLTGGGR